MKKIYILLIGLLTFSVGCSETFTDVDPIGSLNDAQLANAQGIDLLLTGTYSVLDGVRNNGIGNGWGRSADNWVMDVASDDAHKGSTDGDQPDLYSLELYNWQTANGYFLARWGVLFAGVNRRKSLRGKGLRRGGRPPLALSPLVARVYVNAVVGSLIP